MNRPQHTATPTASLSDLAAMVMQTRAKATDACSAPSLFGDAFLNVDQASGAASNQINLATVFQDMQAAGYTLGTPVRAKPATEHRYAEWHVTVTHAGNQATLCFFVAEGATC